MLRHLFSSSDNGQSMVIHMYIPKVLTMLRQLLLSCDNGQSMVIYPWGIIHAPSVVII